MRADVEVVRGLAPKLVRELRSVFSVLMFVASAFALVGCDSGSPTLGRPIADNGQQMKLEIARAYIPAETQSIEQTTMVLGQGFLQAAATGQTYRGPVSEQKTNQPIAPKSGEQFVVVEFSLSNVVRKLELQASDLSLIDGRGGTHVAFALGDPAGPSPWLPFNSLGLVPGDPYRGKWIFQVPKDAIGGSSIRFQNTVYPLSLSGR